MRVNPNSIASAHEVAPQRTPATPSELRAALARAHMKLTGRPASPAMLDVLSAQVSLETGRGGSMYNFNFGGIKGQSPQGATTSAMTREVLPTGEVHLRQPFRAYTSIDEGAEDYLRVMQHRFGGAVTQAEHGNVDGFAHALKQAGYYTAPENDYASALRGLVGQKHGATSSLSALQTATSGDYASSGDMARVIDALSLSAARIAAPADDED